METKTALQTTPIAIIGKAGIFPQAEDARTYWGNIIHKIDCITDVPPSRWNIDDYYDPDPRVPDKTYCKRGGFIPDIAFDPLEFGLPPNILEVTDVSQLLGLVVARDVMEDAGYGAGRAFDRSRVGVILGVAGGQKLITPLASRLQYPVWEKVLKSSGLSDEETASIIEKIKLAYVEWNEDSFPGLLGNVIAGRIANRLDLGGINCVVDAACASSLSAVKMAVSQLLEHRVDMMITGGVDTDNSPFMYMCFSKTPAFSKGEVPRPFDAESDGMMVGEGVGMVLLKRLTDAERDGDRIYAVIRGIGTSSDGRYKSIYAPRSEGQSLALRRAYEDAGIEPLSVGLIEAHGTGTRAGDPTEFVALAEVFGRKNGRSDVSIRHQYVALGSVKSQIGHTKAAAGAAGLIKAALALHHKVLPPTNNVTQPDPQLRIEETPFYVNTETRPWIRAVGDSPRRAGVSAFGFGGTNFHVVLEEYLADAAIRQDGEQLDHTGAYRLHPVAQPFILHAATPAELLTVCIQMLARLDNPLSPEAGVCYAEVTHSSHNPGIPPEAARIGFVAASLTEAHMLLESAVTMLRGHLDAESWEHPKGITYRRVGLEIAGKVVALFPGQGAQYVNMGRELAINFPPLRVAYGKMDRLFLEEDLLPLSSVVFPPPTFSPEGEKAQAAALRATNYAQAAIGVFSMGLFVLLKQAGFRPDFTAGHSFGELSALWASGMLEEMDFLRLVIARGKAMSPPVDANFDAGEMLAVQGALDDIEAEVAQFPNVIIANYNSGTQIVLAGPTADMKRIDDVLRRHGYNAQFLPVSAAFHTPLVSYASESFMRAVALTPFHTPQIPVYSNTMAEPYPADAEAAKMLLTGHILHPVYFKQQIEHIYAAGGRIFVEFGPRSITSHLVEEILEGEPIITVALNASRQKDSDRQFREAVVRLQVAGMQLGNVDPYQI
ncbi:MAG: acyltransferase domain-containing protein [Anaerolineae bacterium]|nr:acyltransferase domain-containing protein [Anaerolineae bacterium]